MKNKDRMHIFMFISKNQILLFHHRPFDARNPYLAPVVASRELFEKGCLRSCLHLELDITNTRLK
jgi:hypothetical protein